MSPRDAHGRELNYFKPDAPRNEDGVYELKTQASYKVYAAATQPYDVTVIDARKVPGGLDAWNLDKHGFS